MVQIGRRRGATSMTVPLMLGAFVFLAGFFYWLWATAEPTAPPEIVDDDTTGSGWESALVVDPAEFGAGPAGYVSLIIRLDGLAVSQDVGDNAFFVSLPQSPFLIHANPASVVGAVPAAGDVVTVIGSVTEMTPEIVERWAAAGEFTEEERPLVEFATHYIEAFEISAAESSDASGAGA